MELSKSELELMLGITQGLLQLDGCRSLGNVFARMQQIIPFDSAVVGMLRVSEGRVTTVEDVHGYNYDKQMLDLYRDKKHVACDAIVRYALSDRRPVGFRQARSVHGAIHACRGACNDNDGIAYAVSSRRAAGMTTLLSLNFDRERVRERYSTMLSYMAPHLHEACIRIAEISIPEGSVVVSPLTRREREILQWVREGKGTWEISVLLTISERTVKFHLSNTMHKLDAMNRSHAVAKALQRGLI